MFLRVFFRYVLSDVRPMGRVGYPVGAAFVGASAGSCVPNDVRSWDES